MNIQPISRDDSKKDSKNFNQSIVSKIYFNSRKTRFAWGRPPPKALLYMLTYDYKISSEDFLKVFYIRVDRSSGEGGPISLKQNCVVKGIIKTI